MNDSPGWASPGPSSSDPRNERGDGSEGRNAPEEPGHASADRPPNWSANQPPPAGGTWGAPPPPGGPGWGQRSNPAWQAAPAPRPGIVPLRPLGLGEILDGTFGLFRRHWRTVLGVSLVVGVVTQLVATLVMGFWFRDGSDLTALDDPDPTLDEIAEAAESTLSGSLVTGVVGVLGTVFATALLTVVISRAVLGRNITFTEAWTEARPQLLRMLGLMLLVPILLSLVFVVGLAPGTAVVMAGAEGAGAALLLLGAFAALAVGIWLWVRWSLAAPALMLEKQGVVSSLKRSTKLVNLTWWRVFGIQLLTVVLVFVIASVIQVPVNFAALLIDGDAVGSLSEATAMSWPYLITTGIGGAIISMLTFPIQAGVTALLYLDQRIRREALDIELARAAGIPGYGDSGPRS
ncbi:hypothetical protein [Streptomyces xiaopingdaonensis]|uniref:hypothetical protein n=1 Tax=Streptomyces xiaopingdaonensis TaxID=1565415 RepID=UPI00037A3543|nr:hypothetical protein [Streptomyces xiaopingdaonensis]